MAFSTTTGGAYVDQAAFVIAQFLDELHRGPLVGMQLWDGAVDVVCDVLLHLLLDLILEVHILVTDPAPALAHGQPGVYRLIAEEDAWPIQQEGILHLDELSVALDAQ